MVMDGWAEVRRWKELAAPMTGQPPACKGALEEGSVYLEKRSMNKGRELGSGLANTHPPPDFFFLFFPFFPFIALLRSLHSDRRFKRNKRS